MHASDPVNRIMSEPVLTVGPDDSVEELLRIFIAYPVHHLPVVKEQRVVGMLSAADLMKIEFFLPPPGPARQTLLKQRFRVDKLMRTPVITVSEHETVQRAGELMAKNGVHSLPVVNTQDRLIGIVTTTDLIHGCLLANGSASSGAREADDEHFKTVDARFADALTAARESVAADNDPHGIAAALLNLQQRLSALEAVTHTAKRYLNAGQDERLHTLLRKAVERVDLLDQHLGRPALLGLDAGE